MIATMDKDFERCHNMMYVGTDNRNVSFHRQLSCSEFETDGEVVDTCQTNRDSIIVRSVAMSANIASTVTGEVDHLIRVDSFNQYNDFKDTPENVQCVQSTASPLTPVALKNSSCSHILPTEGNIISGIILSKWDDIMGPQTVYAWLQNNLAEFNTFCNRVSEPSNQTEGNVRSFECAHSTSIHLMKAISYVTSHTVNYMGVTTANLPPTGHFQAFNEKNSSIFIVRDLNLVAQSLVFQIQTRELNLPYSLAVMIKYDQYDYYLHLRQLTQLWLRWISAQLHHILVSCIQKNKEFVTRNAVDQWILEFNSVLLSLKSCGLGHLLSETWTFSLQIIKHPLIERALTSHLQTFGCTVVMGSCVDKINELIGFLSLFLETDELYCSRFLLPPFNYSFHKGLYLQGLILDEFGCRELNSEELSANPYPVTTIDLSRGTNAGAIKQSSFFRKPTGASKHQYVLCPAKDTRSKLVHNIVNELKFIPVEEWKSLARLFLAKLEALAHTLLSLILGVSSSSAGSGRKPVQLQRYLSHAMGLEDSDFFIVLASAEKLKPGTYVHVMYSHLESR